MSLPMYNKMEMLTIAFVIAMVALAECLGIKDIIFPEIAALAFGAWVMEDRPWEGPAWTLWFSPTLGAITGVLIVHFMQISLAAMIAVAFAFVLLELRLFRSAMSPSFSAAILPILLHTEGLTYPLAVCAMTATVALVSALRHTGRPAIECLPPADRACPSPTEPWTASALHYGKLILLALLVALVAERSTWLYLIAPPLVVVFVELTHPESRLRDKSMRRLLVLLAASALEGMLWVVLVVRLGAGPLWLAAGLAVATALLLAKLLRLASPPAFALSLLPTILPPTSLSLYPLHVLLGSSLFIVLSLSCFNAAPRAQ